MAIKITKKNKRRFQLISGIGFILIGMYMTLILKDIKGQIPLVLGIGILLWRLK